MASTNSYVKYSTGLNNKNPKPVWKTKPKIAQEDILFKEIKKQEPKDSWVSDEKQQWVIKDSKKLQDAWSGLSSTEVIEKNISAEFETLSVKPLPDKRIQSKWEISKDLSSTVVCDANIKKTNETTFAKSNSMAELRPVRENPIVWVTSNREECNYLIRKHFLQVVPEIKFIALDIEGNIGRKMDQLAPSTIQIASFKTCIIIQLYRMINQELIQASLKSQLHGSNVQLREPKAHLHAFPIPEALSELLQNKDICKIGFGIFADKQLLEDHYSNVGLVNFFDFGNLAETLKIPTSLGKFANLFSLERIYAKKETDNKYKIWRDHAKRNWDKKTLTSEEVFYASSDVFSILSAFRGFVRKENSSICPFQSKKSNSLFDIILRPAVEEERVGIENLQSDDGFSDPDNMRGSGFSGQNSDDDNNIDDLEAFQSGKLSFD